MTASTRRPTQESGMGSSPALVAPLAGTSPLISSGCIEIHLLLAPLLDILHQRQSHLGGFITQPGAETQRKRVYKRGSMRVMAPIFTKTGCAPTRDWTTVRRHILSSRRGGPIVAERNGSLYPSRYASIRTSRELTLFGGSVHRMRSVFSVNLGRCDLPSGLSSLRVDQVRIAQSPYVRSEAIGQKKPWPQSHFSLGSSLLCSGIFTSSLSLSLSL